MLPPRTPVKFVVTFASIASSSGDGTQNGAAGWMNVAFSLNVRERVRGLGVGTGVGAGVGTGVGAGVGAGVGIGVGTGVGRSRLFVTV
jgi:hypothetical protein